MFDVRSWGLIQATLGEVGKRAWKECERADRWSPVLVQRAVSEDPRWTRAVGDQSSPPSRKKTEERWSLDARSKG